MEKDIELNAVNAIYYLYFENRELVHHFEIIWSEDGMSSHDETYCYIFCGLVIGNFPIDLETFCFLLDNNIIEQTGGSEHECTYELNEYYRIGLRTRIKEKRKESKTVAK